MRFAIGQSEKERLEVFVRGYCCDQYDNVYDANWLRAEANISSGAFQGSIILNIMTTELAAFAKQASALYESLTGEAEFTTLEEQLKIKLCGDGIGHISVTGYVRDEVGVGFNTLEYELAIDQTQLKSTIDDLFRLLEKYPERKV
jgi:hypothetical protein